MDKFIFFCLMVMIASLIGAGCSAQRQLSWENGYLVLNNERQQDPFRQEYTNILKLSLTNEDTSTDNIIVHLNNSKTTRSFVAELPMDLQFQKYGNSEYISYLDKKLKVDDKVAGYSPRKGDICYYEPWGNITFYTQDGNFTHGLIKIGQVQEGTDNIAKLATAKNIFVDLTQ